MANQLVLRFHDAAESDLSAVTSVTVSGLGLRATGFAWATISINFTAVDVTEKPSRHSLRLDRNTAAALASHIQNCLVDFA
jgi:hypothetical protein